MIHALAIVHFFVYKTRLQVWVQMLQLMQYSTYANTCQSIGWDVSYLPPFHTSNPEYYFGR